MLVLGLTLVGESVTDISDPKLRARKRAKTRDISDPELRARKRALKKKVSA